MAEKLHDQSGRLSVDIDNIFPIIRQWLYSDQDIFIRELISNACDAITKRQSLVRLGESAVEFTPRIQVTLDENARQLKFSDNGIGMTAEEIDKYINRVAFSGAVDFLAKYQEDSKSADGIIGHFGLGFYSAFMPAEKVEIFSLSYLPGAKAAHWLSEDGVSYTLSEGEKAEVGTEIIITLSDEAQKFVNAGFVRATLHKYCYFMPQPIFFTSVKEEAEESAREAAAAAAKAKKDETAATNEAAAGSGDTPATDEAATDTAQKRSTAPQPLNNTSPLWLKKPSECTDEEYLAFYREAFQDFNPPLFWIHLNMDYPFNLKGILYFPKQNEEKIATLDGRIKLYSNQVFVADNIKEVIPDFLFLLRGCIDCPDLPLNVSRSFLQHDAYVQKLSAHIVKKVADKLNEIFRKDLPAYEKSWDSISTFVKYGMMRDEKFYEKANSALIFRKTDDTWLHWAEAPKEIYYTVDKEKQAYYVDLAISRKHEVVCLGKEIDAPFINFLEYKRPDTHFIAVEAENNNEAGDSEILPRLQEAFSAYAADVDFGVAALGVDALPAVLMETEEGKRAKQMREMFKQMGQDLNDPNLNGMMQAKNKLVFNTDNAIWTKLLNLSDAETKAELIAQLYDLAKLNYGILKGNELTAFLQRSDLLLKKLAE